MKRIFRSLFLCTVIPFMATGQATDGNKEHLDILVGTYTSGKSEGIYLYSFNPETGKLIHRNTAKDVENPSFVKAGPDGKFVYSVNEESQGAVSAFHYDESSGVLDFISEQSTQGAHPCYLSVSPNGKHLIVGNYSGGNIAVFQLNNDGSIKPASQIIDHEGSSINKSRQEKPHVHSVVFSPDGKYLLSGDLGTDRIYIYTYNGKIESQPLIPAESPWLKVEPGSGPRHLIFNKTGDVIYAVMELTAQVGVYKFSNGELSHIQTIPMTSDDFEGEVSGAEIKLSPDEKFLYASNRGDANEIIVYQVSKEGKLEFVQRISSMGKTPRNFMITPEGDHLLVANQNSDNIIIFRRDKESGKLTPTGERVEVGNPVYLNPVIK